MSLSAIRNHPGIRTTEEWAVMMVLMDNNGGAYLGEPWPMAPLDRVAARVLMTLERVEAVVETLEGRGVIVRFNGRPPVHPEWSWWVMPDPNPVGVGS